MVWQGPLMALIQQSATSDRSATSRTLVHKDQNSQPLSDTTLAELFQLAQGRFRGHVYFALMYGVQSDAHTSAFHSGIFWIRKSAITQHTAQTKERAQPTYLNKSR